MDAVTESRKEQEVDLKRLQSNLVDTVIHLTNETWKVTPAKAR